MKVLKIDCTRDSYGMEDAAEKSMTVGELMRELEDYDDETHIVFSFDNGYTYGKLSSSKFEEVDVENDEDNDEDIEEV